MKSTKKKLKLRPIFTSLVDFNKKSRNFPINSNETILCFMSKARCFHGSDKLFS